MALITKIAHAVKPKTYTIKGPGIVPDDPISQLESLISMVLGILTIIGVIFFTIQIILAGYSFMSAKGDKEKIADARKKITNSILGLAIVVIAFGLAAFLANLLGLGNVFNLVETLEPIIPQ